MNVTTELEVRDEGLTARRTGQTTREVLIRGTAPLGEKPLVTVLDAVRRAYQMGREDARQEQQLLARGLFGF